MGDSFGIFPKTGKKRVPHETGIFITVTGWIKCTVKFLQRHF